MVAGGGSGGGGSSVGGRHGEVDRFRKRTGTSFFTFGFLLFFLASVTKRCQWVPIPQPERGGVGPNTMVFSASPIKRGGGPPKGHHTAMHHLTDTTSASRGKGTFVPIFKWNQKLQLYTAQAGSTTRLPDFKGRISWEVMGITAQEGWV